MILTKRPGADDDVSDADAEDITSLYKNPDGMSRYQKQGDFNYHFSKALEQCQIDLATINICVSLWLKRSGNVVTLSGKERYEYEG